MDQDYRQTVLQRASHGEAARPAERDAEGERERERERERPVEQDQERREMALDSSSGSPHQHHQRHSTFGLRSPTRSHQGIPQNHHHSPSDLSHHHQHQHQHQNHRHDPHPHPPATATPTAYQPGPPQNNLHSPARQPPALSNNHHHAYGRPRSPSPPSSHGASTLPPPTSARHQPPSPLQPPAGYYTPSGASLASGPSAPDMAHHSRDGGKPATGSFYDPTTDTTTIKERRVSETWHPTQPSQSAVTGNTTRDPYAYPQHGEQRPSYYNSSYTSPRPSSSSHNPPRSPLSHSHPNPALDSHSPSSRQHVLPSPDLRHAATPTREAAGTNGAPAYPSLLKADPMQRSPLKPTPPASGTPGRADPMSFSNILSSAEPAPRPRPESPTVTVASVRARDTDIDMYKSADTEAEEPRRGLVHHPDTEAEADTDSNSRKGSRPPLSKKSKPLSKKGRASDIRDAATPKGAGRSTKEPSSLNPSVKRQSNGLPKPKTWSTEMEKKILAAEARIDEEVSKISPRTSDKPSYYEVRRKRQCTHLETEEKINERRRWDWALMSDSKLTAHALMGKQRFDDLHYDDALNEVREQELFAEKERKKDMQRKRRREKSMAVTMELKEQALARANAAEDDEERQKHLREAERASKKAQQTKLILQKGIKGPARNLDLKMDLEGGSLSSFQLSDIESGKGKSKGKAGNRPKKSREQKQAEKQSAEAAQAAIDAGEDLPPPKEETKHRSIKLKKSKDKKRDRDLDDDTAKEDFPDGDLDGTAKDRKKKKKGSDDVDDLDDKENLDLVTYEAPDLEKKFTTKGFKQITDQIWRDMARKDVNKTFKLAVDSYATKGSNLKKTAILASKEAKRWQLRTNKGTKDLQARAKRVMRDMMGFWKRNEREERDLRKAAEKQELENARKEDADREAARQKRKLNFLISQTELYSHFIGKKIKTDEVERSTDHPDEAKAPVTTDPKTIDVAEPSGPVVGVTKFENLDFDNEDESSLRAAAMANAQNAIAEAQKKAREFNNESLDMDDEGEMNFQNPAGLGDLEIAQPKILNATLKEYQLKGLNWLVNLYEQGINGILADEMGLGKTVQSISVMAYLAEKHDIWGPFLVVAPASTLHNWQQEIAKFVPEFKVLPYWGSAGDRKVLRKFWDRKHSTYRKDAAFHVCITSYQLVVSDVAYFQKMRWQYMILDEAQAIKSSSSSRWKSLLGFHCRNRLLLTGTPIQNNMQELWALLHFIMPSLFDSHDEFSEWFSKDIESHAQSNTKLNEDQLKRLHMILKPFMLRRVKKHVQKELGDKIELDVVCDLTYRQRAYYTSLRNQINFLDLVEKATSGDDQDSGTLTNLVMQFRKVCNHPDLFERAVVRSPFACAYFAETASFVREGNNVTVGYSSRSMVDYELPALVWSDEGRLNRASRANVKAGWRNKALNHLMNVWSPDNVRDSVEGSQAFSWLRFADATPGDVYKASHSSIFTRAKAESNKSDRLRHMKVVYDDPEDNNFVPAHALFDIAAQSDRQPLANITKEGYLNRLMNVAREDYGNSGIGRLELAGRSRATAPPIDVSCNSRAAVSERENILFNVPMRKALYGPATYEEETLVEKKYPLELLPQRSMLPSPDHEKNGFTSITVPSMRRFVTDSGKLAKLDELLFQLKNGGHRVLLYFQMTRMIDMMEEYLTYRNYTYCRLDGSTKLEDRRDTVADFQTRPDIFIFLLSTRAGGLGINLTSADTVIFYDSDWNPTIDSQAMDRAHRLGQTRQVTVYRLITRGTIEERIRKRALQKEEVQRVVIQGGGASVDFSGRRNPENRNREIAMWLADDEQAEMIERREKELAVTGEADKGKKKGGKKKKANAPTSLDDMYHEGEGNFDDGNKHSGTATPADSDARAQKPKIKGAAKKAKTAKQRLAAADGLMDG